MSIRRLTRNDADFYLIMGPVFGSRAIEKATHDRFYDDPGKLWYVSEQSAGSVLNGVIRNFYAPDGVQALSLLRAMQADHKSLTGVVPKAHEGAFTACGFTVWAHSKNFIEVRYEKD